MKIDSYFKYIYIRLLVEWYAFPKVIRFLYSPAWLFFPLVLLVGYLMYYQQYLEFQEKTKNDKLSTHKKLA